MKIWIGDSKVGQGVLLAPLLLTDAILGPDILIDHAAELSFPDRNVSVKINEKFCKFEFQGAREATRQEAAETAFKKQDRNVVLTSSLPCTTMHLSAESDIGQPQHLERNAAVKGNKLS